MTETETAPTFEHGYYSRARRVDAHPVRVGAAIEPWGIVVHTTDMLDGSFSGLLARWHREPGFGDCAHFIIGRAPAQGVVQLVPINHNANHAGGSRKVEGEWVP